MVQDKWVYLWVDDDRVELRDAEKFLGKDTHETEGLIKEHLGVNRRPGVRGRASVAAIAPADAGPAAGKSVAPYLEGWVRDYYEHLGWGRKTGKPMRLTLKKLGLEEFMRLVWG